MTSNLHRTSAPLHDITPHFSGGMHILTSRVHIHGGLLARLSALFVLLTFYAAWVVPAAVPAGAQSKDTPAAGSDGQIANVPDNPYGVNVFLHKEVEAWKI